MTNRNKNKISGTEFKILESFFPEGEEITLKKIMERGELSYEPVYRTVKQLVDKKIISVKKFGKTLVYSLNSEKDSVKIAFILYADERKEEFSNKHARIARVLSKLPEDKIDFLAVFGSYAKGHPTKRSDVDLICITSNKKKIEKEIRSLRYETNLEFTPVVIPKIEFAKIKYENNVFWKDLIKYGIIFKGYELFYYYAYLK